MTSPSLTRKALDESKRRHERTIGADWRYPEFFNFLQVSPSYRLAHRIATGRLDRRAATLPMDFAVVEETYRAFGDVTQAYYWDWWIKTAQYQFNMSVPATPKTLLKLDLRQDVAESDIALAKRAVEDHLTVDRLAQGTPSTLLIALPLHPDRRTMLQIMKAMVEKAYADEAVSKGLAPYAMIKNKMRKATVDKARQVLRAQAARPKEKLFIIGNLTQVSPKNYTDPNEKRASVDVQRRVMEILTSRHLHRAYLLAENAARGRFPCLDQLPEDPNRPKFDYRVLHNLYKSHGKWLEAERERLKALMAKKSAQQT